MDALYFSSEELFELRWIFDSLINSSLRDSNSTYNDKITHCTVFMVSPSRLLSIFEKLNVMSVSSEYREKVHSFAEKFNLDINGK